MCALFFGVVVVVIENGEGDYDERSKLLTEGAVSKRYPERPDESGTEPDSPSPSIVHGP